MVREITRPGRDIAVVGAGVNGLMCARLLQQAGYGVSIYTDRMPAETTSHVAGGQWAPAGVSLDGSGFDEICRRSFALYAKLIGEEFGVFRRPNYVTGRGGGGFSNLPRGVLAPAEHLERLPFDGPPRSGRVYQTLLVEPPRLLARVSEEAFASSVRVESRRFASVEELLDLDETIVVNCMGLGARDVVGDRAVYSVRGQLVHLAPQDLPYLLSHRGYIFPRSDAVILGGTYERGVDSTATGEATCARLLRVNWAFFE
jgi:glycine/D-amino acid oxidase-like deaminating enzyme